VLTFRTIELLEALGSLLEHCGILTSIYGTKKISNVKEAATVCMVAASFTLRFAYPAKNVCCLIVFYLNYFNNVFIN